MSEKLISAFSRINREMGIIEGVAFGLPEKDATAVFGAVEAIDEALKKIEDDGKRTEI